MATTCRISDPALINFDRADRKFVAIASPSRKPPILNATDTDWWHHLAILEKQGVQITFPVLTPCHKLNLITSPLFYA